MGLFFPSASLYPTHTTETKWVENTDTKTNGLKTLVIIFLDPRSFDNRNALLNEYGVKRFIFFAFL